MLSGPHDGYFWCSAMRCMSVLVTLCTANNIGNCGIGPCVCAPPPPIDHHRAVCLCSLEISSRLYSKEEPISPQIAAQLLWLKFQAQNGVGSGHHWHSYGFYFPTSAAVSYRHLANSISTMGNTSSSRNASPSGRDLYNRASSNMLHRHRSISATSLSLSDSKETLVPDLKNQSPTATNNPFRRQGHTNYADQNNLTVPGSEYSFSSHHKSRSAGSSPIIENRRPMSLGADWNPAPPSYETAVWNRRAAASGVPNIQVSSTQAPDVSFSSSQRRGRRRRNTRELEYLRAPMRQESIEDALETLRRYNTIILVDDSGSMQLDDRWDEARQALIGLTEIAAQYDADGVDLHFLNSNVKGLDLKDATRIRSLFDQVKPRGSTPIGYRLEMLLLAYMDKLDTAKRMGNMDSIKPVNFIVLTDGAATDDPESVIVTIAGRLDRDNYPSTQVGIQFVQVGHDKAATAYLHELDDGLQKQFHVRDIVDTTPYTGGKLTAVMLTKILLGGINRRVDRKGGASVF